MTKPAILALISASLLFSACISPQVASLPQSPSDEIVIDSSTNSEGEVLKMYFNNTQNTLFLTLKEKKILLEQQPMASGIRYTNESYEFSEWHGEIHLRKGKKVLFEHKEEK